MIYGICAKCGEYKALTKNHLIGVRDLKVIYPEMSIHELNRKKNPWSPVILICRPCHNIYEHEKKVRISDETPEKHLRSRVQKIQSEKSPSDVERIREKYRMKYGHLLHKAKKM